MPRISVVVPIYNVEPYLEECLGSIAGQTYGDLEVVMVDDGSADRSPDIAKEFAARDGRFKLIQQPNAGLGAARNTGIDAATGEFITFVDSDDFIAPNAYELLINALDETGSDFATGNVVRLTTAGERPVWFLTRAFSKTRLATHVTEHRALIADRTAWNKLFRRSFWDAQGRRFPEGVLNEDIPVILPAHFAAKSVDVIADPIYYWRIRDGEELSITQRRLEPKALLDRLRAIEAVDDYLAQHGKRRWRGWYEESVVADDLTFYLNPLPAADEEYRELFLDRVNALLDRASDRIYDPLPAIERLKWHLVRRRLMPELLEVIRFQKEQLKQTPPVEIDGRWYGDYPYREDARLKIPKDVYLLEGELGLMVEVEALEWVGDRVRVRGYAYIRGIGAPAAGRHELTAKMLRRGRMKRLRLLVSGVKLEAKVTHRPDVTANSQQSLADLSWAGFEVFLDPSSLRSRGRLQTGIWDLYLTLRAGKVKRRRGRFHQSRLRPVRSVQLPTPDGVLAKVMPNTVGGITLDVRDQWMAVRDQQLVKKGVIELAGELHGEAPGKPVIEVSRPHDLKTFRYKLAVDSEQSPAAFSARVKVADLIGARHLDEDSEQPDEDDETDDELGASDNDGDGDEFGETDDRVVWHLHTVGGGQRAAVGLAPEAAGTAWQRNGRVLSLSRTRRGDASLIEQAPRPQVNEARWTGDGALELSGELPAETSFEQLVITAWDYGDEYSVALETDGDRFSVRLPAARMESLAGTLPLRAGTWSMFASRPSGERVPFAVASALYDHLPLRTVVDHKPFALGMTRTERAVLSVQRDLDEDERGGFHQRRLRDEVYVTSRSQPLREAVLYISFHGRQYSDSPRAIHEELARRELPLEHLWVVQDGQAAVPETARVVRYESREYHEALATARYIVSNDHYPDWWARRDDQVALQTWHGTPLKRLGMDVESRRQTLNRFTRWQQQINNWQYVVSPNRFSTPILKRAYAIEGELLETGYPRVDLLARADRDERGAELRRRLGIPEGKRTVLYAPTYRDNVFDRRGRYRLDLQLDLKRLREAVGDDTVILFRKHHYIPDPVPVEPQGFVMDVSRYPDGTELMLAADVLVTDYSSMMFDFANTGRPMLFYTYDLDAYADEIRGFYFDLGEASPGPLLRTTDELADALNDLDGVRATYAERYRAFVERFCELDDGHAAARVVDRLFLP
jgi:CDP-glycerol glycerophosphotransferase